MYTPPFTITDEVLQLVSEICLHVGRIEAISQSRLPSPMLRKANRIRTIHSSLAIEHNSLTLQQVTDIVNGKRVLGAPDEILEVKNAIDAYRLLQQLDAFSQEDLLKTHTAMMHDLVHTAGHFRNEGVGVFDKDGSCVHMAPAAERVPWLMKDLFEWVSSTTIHPLISSCVFHYEFEFIHPFIDGNGRLGRFWQTLLLSRWKPVFAWFPVESIVHDNQEGYYAIDNSHLSIRKYMANALVVSLFFNNFASNLNILAMNELNRIKVVLVEHKRTGKWLAEQLGVSVTTTSRWCSNAAQPDLCTLAKIALLLDVDVKDLIVSTKK